MSHCININYKDYTLQAYTEVREAGHFKKNLWDIIHKKLKESGNTSESEWDGCLSNVKIGKGSFPVFEAVLRLKHIN